MDNNKIRNYISNKYKQYFYNPNLISILPFNNNYTSLEIKFVFIYGSKLYLLLKNNTLLGTDCFYIFDKIKTRNSTELGYFNYFKILNNTNKEEMLNVNPLNFYYVNNDLYETKENPPDYLYNINDFEFTYNAENGGNGNRLTVYHNGIIKKYKSLDYCLNNTNCVAYEPQTETIRFFNGLKMKYKLEFNYEQKVIYVNGKSINSKIFGIKNIQIKFCCAKENNDYLIIHLKKNNSSYVLIYDKQKEEFKHFSSKDLYHENYNGMDLKTTKNGFLFMTNKTVYLLDKKFKLIKSLDLINWNHFADKRVNLFVDREHIIITGLYRNNKSYHFDYFIYNNIEMDLNRVYYNSFCVFFEGNHRGYFSMKLNDKFLIFDNTGEFLFSKNSDSIELEDLKVMLITLPYYTDKEIKIEKFKSKIE